MGDFSGNQTSDAGSVNTHHERQPVNTSGPPPFVDKSTVAGEHEPPYLTQPQPVTSHQAFTNQYDMTQPSPAGRGGPYNMAALGSTLPSGGYRPGQYSNHGPQRYNTAASSPMMPQMQHFAGQQVSVAPQGYYVPQHQMAYYGSQYSQAQVSQRQGMAYYPNQMMMNQQQQQAFFYPPQQYAAASHHQQLQGLQGAMMQTQYMHPNSTVLNNAQPATVPNDSHIAQSLQPSHGQDASERRQNTVRGPPRKPRQSGHAIWIGNLPPQTELMSLVHHVCAEAPGLESLFLISKSNCAFANFQDEGTCMAAQQKLHDSKFQAVRLVSRLRKSTVEGTAGVTAPTGPAIVSSASVVPAKQRPDDPVPVPGEMNPYHDATTAEAQTGQPALMSPQKDKFFILKSLTVEDLDLSVRTGIWATQSHNEETLNSAFNTGDNVYLVFSANKSGEYYGYARMTSRINEDPAAAIEFAPKAQTTSDLDLPKAIPTEATEHAPKGRIIDDSARGTIFWEAERDDGDNDSDAESEVSSGKSANADEPSAKTWGKPFKLEWMSTTRLPFYRTRGLRNPWNSNREVKIARDGTELEPSVGRRLIGLFNRVQSPGPVQAGIPIPVAVIPGFPQMRGYGP